MSALKTQQTNASVEDFINSVADTEQKCKDSFEFLKPYPPVRVHTNRNGGIGSCRHEPRKKANGKAWFDDFEVLIDDVVLSPGSCPHEQEWWNWFVSTRTGMVELVRVDTNHGRKSQRFILITGKMY